MTGPEPTTEPTTKPRPPSAWVALRVAVFRNLWLALLASNIGTWMQTVGAQWLLVDEPNASVLVAVVQTAGMLPALLLALPAGAVADSFDRRRLLISVQTYMLAVGVILTGLTAIGQMPPALLLTLTFALGVGNALTIPAWQALIPELVPRDQLPSASALAAISMNVARSVGPAIAGVLIAWTGVATVFAINAASYLVLAVVLATWRRSTDADNGRPERFTSALRAGGRYVRHSPVVRRILLRACLFVVPGSALWALLPLEARRLGLDSSGYGLLLAALGVGAVGGAVVMPRLREGLSANTLLAAASLAYAASAVTVALAPAAWLAVAALPLAGTAWTTVLSSTNVAMQLFLPVWVRARGLAVLQIVFAGGQALGALAWGVLADAAGLAAAQIAAGAVLVVGATTIGRWPLRDTQGLNRDPAVYWPEPQLVVEPEPHTGPILITASYQVRPENAEDFIAAMEAVRRSRMRTGATRWGLFRDGEVKDTFVEVYLVPSWDEHMRQHEGRLTGSDQVAEERAHALTEGPPRVSHLLPASTDYSTDT
jgi:MFS family permease